MLKNKGERLVEVRQAFFTCFALTVGTRHLGAICDVPWAILLDDCRELIAHVYILPPKAGSRRHWLYGRAYQGRVDSLRQAAVPTVAR
jgi:hypothetical protein